ncbi:hypothetical protein BDV93DRAFT_545791 [Ceratobasidium sp. AG-I]|nr:hypothetical protein BDV93DRAFT_545791 [Ceratobasidium sp. AG-I]
MTLLRHFLQCFSAVLGYKIVPPPPDNAPPRFGPPAPFQQHLMPAPAHPPYYFANQIPAPPPALALQPPAPAPEAQAEVGAPEVPPLVGRQRPNAQTSPGVFRVPVHVLRADGELRIFSVDTNIAWVDFYSRSSAHLDEVNTDSLMLRHSKMPTSGRFRAANLADWATFVNMLMTHIESARQKPVEIQVFGQKQVAVAKPAGGSKKRARTDDIPPDVLDPDAEPGSAAIYLKLKTRLACEYHSRAGNSVYCFIRNPTDHPDLHQPVSLKFIGIWATKCLSGDATEHHPPNCLPLDSPPKKRGRSGNKNDVHVTIHHEAAPGPSNHTGALANASIPSTDSPLLDSCDAGLLSQANVGSETADLGRECDIFIAFPEIKQALSTLHATKPAHGFLNLLEPLCSAGYKYVDDLDGVSADELGERLKIGPLQARQVLACASLLARQAREEANYVIGI